MILLKLLGLIIALGTAIAIVAGIFYFVLYAIWFLVIGPHMEDIFRQGEGKPRLETYDPKNVSKEDAKAIDKALKSKNFKGKKIGTAKVIPPRRKK